VTPDPPSTSPERFAGELHAAVSAAHDAFADAAARAGSIESVRVVAGEPVRFRVAGPALAEHLLPALDHLPPTAAAPVFTASAWDTRATGVPVPLLADAPSGPAPSRAIVAGTRAVSSSPTRTMFEGYDGAMAEGWFAIGNADDLTTGERGAPFRLALHWWLTARGLQFAHGGAVGEAGTAVLVVGPTGAGKSSTTLSCVEAGLDYVADDYCVIQTAPGTAPHDPPVAHGLYSSAKILFTDVERYPKLVNGRTPRHNPIDDKTLVLVHRAVPAQVVTEQRLGAIVVPQRTGRRRSTFARTRAGVGLQALAPSTVGQFPGGAAVALSSLAALARAVPSYRLDLGTDRATVPHAVRAILADLEQP